MVQSRRPYVLDLLAPAQALELVFDSRLGCEIPDGKLQKITNVNDTAKCIMCRGRNNP